jgi:aspartyl protease family protein
LSLLRAALAVGLALAAAPSWAQGVRPDGAPGALPGLVLAGRMGERALLVIDGRPYTLAVGGAAAGVRFLRWNGESAEFEHAGATLSLRIGGAPAQVGAGAAASAMREIVITAGPGGHYIAAGAVNGHPAQFMVDTGATLVSLGRADAERLGVDLRNARNAYTQTANGAVPMLLVTLGRVRVGEVELSNIAAAVLPLPLPLGNSFLARFQMRRENDVMRLELR